MEVEMYEASPEVAQYVNGVCDRFKQEANGNLISAMSLAISVCAQVFLSCGGDIEKSEQIGEAVKAGVITTLGAYKNVSKATHKISRRVN